MACESGRLQFKASVICAVALVSVFLSCMICESALESETNLALERSVTVSSVFSTNPQSSTAAESAVDGDPATKWLSAIQYGQEQWIIVDLGGLYDIQECEIIADYGEKLMSYRLDCSIDGLNFVTFAERCLEDSEGVLHDSGNVLYVDSGYATARFVRLTITGVEGGMTSGRIRELRVFGAEANEVIAEAGTLGTAWGEQHAGQPTGNPILPGYFADPSVAQFDGIYYIYSTCDLAPQPVVWRSDDFVDWRFEGVTMPYMGIWAPSVAKAGDKYYMYYTFDGQIYVGVSSSPEGPWTSKLLIRRDDYDCWTIDAEVFVDNDGQAYLYFGNGRCYVAKLSDDMMSLDGRAIDITPIYYFEGPYMFERNGIYYLMWSQFGFQDPRYQVHYAMGPSPLGPFEYQSGNPILKQDPSIHITGTGHHSVLNPEGTDDYYIVYHRHEIPYVDGTHRQICIDRMEFADDGRILRVTPTHTGVGPLGPMEPRDVNLALFKPAAASSYDGLTARPELALDCKFGTRWLASGAAKPQWLAVDLLDPHVVKRCELAFEFISEYTQYRIEVSVDGVTWSLFADRSTNTEVAYPLVDVGEAVARYVRVVVTGTQTPSRPAGVFEFAVYGHAINGGVDQL